MVDVCCKALFVFFNEVDGFLISLLLVSDSTVEMAGISTCFSSCITGFFVLANASAIAEFAVEDFVVHCFLGPGLLWWASSEISPWSLPLPLPFNYIY